MSKGMHTLDDAETCARVKASERQRVKALKFDSVHTRFIPVDNSVKNATYFNDNNAM